jgi:hypothetical protein
MSTNKDFKVKNGLAANSLNAAGSATVPALSIGANVFTSWNNSALQLADFAGGGTLVFNTANSAFNLWNNLYNDGTSRYRATNYAAAIALGQAAGAVTLATYPLGTAGSVIPAATSSLTLNQTGAVLVIGGTNITTVSSTGLAVTGALSTSGSVTVGGTAQITGTAPKVEVFHGTKITQNVSGTDVTSATASGLAVIGALSASGTATFPNGIGSNQWSSTCIAGNYIPVMSISAGGYGSVISGTLYINSSFSGSVSQQRFSISLYGGGLISNCSQLSYGVYGGGAAPFYLVEAGATLGAGSTMLYLYNQSGTAETLNFTFVADAGGAQPTIYPSAANTAGVPSGTRVKFGNANMYLQTASITEDTSGNLGLGTAAHSGGLLWSGFKTIEISQLSSLGTNSVGTYLSSNAYWDGAIGWRLSGAAAASQILMQAGAITFSTAASGAANALVNGTGGFTASMVLDGGGNLGLGVAPSPWFSSWKAIDSGAGSIAIGGGGIGNSGVYLANNLYLNTSSQWIYKTTFGGSYYQLLGSSHNWYTVSSGTAGTVASAIQSMSLSPTGLAVTALAPSSGAILSISNTSDTGGDTRYASLDFVVGADASTASIRAYRTNSANDYQNALVFYTKSNGAGANVPNEKMRLDSNGALHIGGPNTAYSPNYHVVAYKAATNTALLINSDNGYYPYINFSNYGSKASFGYNYNAPTPAWQWCAGYDGLGVGAAMSLNASGVVVAGGWSGTGSAAGKLGGVVQTMWCERNGVGAVGQVFSYGNGSSTGKGMRMPFAGKILNATITGAALNGTVTAQVYLNGTASTSYQVTMTSTGADAGATSDFSAAPLSFAAGDVIGWYQAAAPTAVNSIDILYTIIYD